VPTPPDSAQHADVTGRSDDLDRLRLVLLRLSRRIRANSVGELTPSQFSLFTAVAKRGPVPVGHIAEIEHVRPPTASKIIAKLEDRGLVQRTADPDDRRCALIELSAAGREYLDEVRAAGRTWLAGQIAELDDADTAMLNDALPALERLLAADR
jgi:DNA-binding MarR family transcriptional regulator